MSPLARKENTHASILSRSAEKTPIRLIGTRMFVAWFAKCPGSSTNLPDIRLLSDSLISSQVLTHHFSEMGVYVRASRHHLVSLPSSGVGIATSNSFLTSKCFFSRHLFVKEH